MRQEIIKMDSPELQGIEKSKAEQIKATFEPMAEMLSSFEESYKEVITLSEKEITESVTSKAKRLRLDISKVRIETGKLKDKQKEYIKLEDRAIMGVHNILVWAVKEKEDKLKEIEDYFENQERKRLEILQHERVELLSKYVEDAQERNLSGMEEDVWSAYLNTKKKEYEDMLEAERKAEQERIEREKAEKVEQERIRKENERLRKEAQERERIAKIEADKRAEQERKEREAHEAAIRKEREAREKIEAELRAKAKAEQERVAKEEAAKEAELNKGDSAKVKDLINDLDSLKTKYSFKSAKNNKMYSDVGLLIDKVINHISSK